MMRYCIRDWFEDGGDARMMSDPAALGKSRHSQREKADGCKEKRHLARKTP